MSKSVTNSSRQEAKAVVISCLAMVLEGGSGDAGIG